MKIMLTIFPQKQNKFTNLQTVLFVSWIVQYDVFDTYKLHKHKIGWNGSDLYVTTVYAHYAMQHGEIISSPEIAD